MIQGIKLGRALSLSVFLLASLQAHADPKICRNCPAEVPGDIVQRNSDWKVLWIGHTGIYGGERQLIDVKGGRGGSSLQMAVPVTEWLKDFAFWGAKRHRSSPDGLADEKQQALEARIRYFASWRTEYDANHFNQKGKFVAESWYRDEPFWEFDCVGFVERVMEDIGLNITDDDKESGWGWPLTPREQRDSAHVVHTQ